MKAKFKFSLILNDKKSIFNYLQLVNYTRFKIKLITEFMINSRILFNDNVNESRNCNRSIQHLNLEARAQEVDGRRISVHRLELPSGLG